ncbi:hypothetical protein OZ13_14000 [Xanthomonas cannabis pv. cannabis]|nr:hypothetical protein OZ13_14000 [Xanthomonas cannabis pv. cannabis]
MVRAANYQQLREKGLPKKIFSLALPDASHPSGQMQTGSQIISAQQMSLRLLIFVTVTSTRITY